MIIKCIVCCIKQQHVEDVKPAEYIMNGQGVCFDHTFDVAAGPGETVAISIAKSGTS